MKMLGVLGAEQLLRSYKQVYCKGEYKHLNRFLLKNNSVFLCTWVAGFVLPSAFLFCHNCTVLKALLHFLFCKSYH